MCQIHAFVSLILKNDSNPLYNLPMIVGLYTKLAIYYLKSLQELHLRRASAPSIELWMSQYTLQNRKNDQLAASIRSTIRIG